MVSEEQDGGFRKGPLEMGIADLGAGRAQAFPGGFLGTFDQAAIGDKILDPGEAVDIMDFVEQHEARESCRCRARFAADTGCWRHGAWRC